MIKKDKDKIYVNKIQMDNFEYYFVYYPLRDLINLCRRTYIKNKFANTDYEKMCIAKEYTYLTSKPMNHIATRELARKAKKYLQALDITPTLQKLPKNKETDKIVEQSQEINNISNVIDLNNLDNTKSTNIDKTQ